MGKFLTTCLLVSGLACQAGGTTIVVLWTPERIVLGADDLQLKSDFSPRNRGACKIHRAGEFVWAAAYLIEDTRTKLSVAELINRSMATHQDLAGVASVFEHDAIEALDKQLKYLMRSFRPADIQEVGRLDHQPISEVVIAGIEGNQPGYYYFQFTAEGLTSDSPHIVVAVKDHCPASNCATPSGVFMGMKATVKDYVAQNKNWWTDLGAVGSIRKFIALESEALPQYVGSEVDMIEIGASGTRWIQRPGCIGEE